MQATRPPPSALLDLLCDNHVHTRFCGHATGEMEEYVLSAIARGLRKIVFLEHMEEGIVCQPATWLSEEAFDCYFCEGRRLQQRYGGQLDIGLGVECGYNPDCLDALRARLDRRQWDRIGISCHYLKPAGAEEHLNLFSRREKHIGLARQFGLEKLLDLYFQTLHQAVRQLPGTMLCHLDAALRFVPETSLTDTHFRMIDRLLQAVRDKGMSMEINTFGVALRHHPFPAKRIIAMAHSYRIPLVLGSDAHMPADIGRHFNEIVPFIPALL